MILRVLALLLLLIPAAASAEPGRAEIERTMRRATEFMVDEVSTDGGYVWSYLPDMSRRWGELEAYPTMIWIQPPGTATMGHIFLDAFHATGDDYYYRAAGRVADALIRGQHESGGWNYFADFAGEDSARRWYATIGRNAWRMEEFQHYSDNATFDDAGSSEAMQFLLRIYLERRDGRFRPALDKAINFVLESQYPNGGWPQRYPYDPAFPEYARYITFNDDVAAENIRFLIMVLETLGDQRARDAIQRGMEVFLATQLPAPQAGWALQHTLDGQPAAARSYEPRALATHTTAANIRQLMNFYRLTGDPRFVARIPEALDWLETVRLPAEQIRGNRAFPTFIEIGTNRPIYVHRRGSNVANGEYVWDYSPQTTIGHYSAFRAVDTAALRQELTALRATPVAQLRAASPLFAAPRQLPRYFIDAVNPGSDLNAAGGGTTEEIVESLNVRGYWSTLLRATSNPYHGPGPADVAMGDYRTTHVGDASDTSPYPTHQPVIGISTATYIANMSRLIAALRAD